MPGRASGAGPAPRDKHPLGARSPVSPPPPPSAPPAPPVSGEEPLRRTVRVVNPLGLHLRVADRFTKVAKQYTCTVTVWNGDARADGANIWDLIGLLVMPDSDVILEVAGPDAAKAVDLLVEILASPGGEDYTI